jgi:hypothetical protein
MHYVKKPVMIEAVQWTAELDRISTSPGADRSGNISARPEGTVMAYPVTGSSGDPGEIYPCKPEIFRRATSQSTDEAVAEACHS